MNIQQLKNQSVYEKALSLVSPDRAKRVLNMRDNDDRLRVLAAGVLVNSGLSFYGLSAATEPVITGRYGKPYFKNYPEIHFNISHSGEYAVAVFSETRVGIDIEHLRPIRESLVKYSLDEKELAEYENAAPSDKTMVFLKFWTKKEAFFKYNETGINIKPCLLDSTCRNALNSLFFTAFTEYPDHIITLCSESKEILLSEVKL